MALPTRKLLIQETMTTLCSVNPNETPTNSKYPQKCRMYVRHQGKTPTEEQVSQQLQQTMISYVPRQLCLCGPVRTTHTVFHWLTEGQKYQ